MLGEHITSIVTGNETLGRRAPGNVILVEVTDITDAGSAYTSMSHPLLLRIQASTYVGFVPANIVMSVPSRKALRALKIL